MISVSKRHNKQKTSPARTAEQQKTDIMMMSFQLSKQTDKLKPWVITAAGMWILGSVGLIIALLILLGNILSLTTVNPGPVFIAAGVCLLLMLILIIITGQLWRHRRVTSQIKSLIEKDTSADFRHLNEYFSNQPALRQKDQAKNLMTSLLHFADGQTHLLDMTNVIIPMSRLSPQRVVTKSK